VEELCMEVRPDGTVVTLYGDKVLDTDTEWRAQIGNQPVRILARMLDSMAYWADQYYVEPTMPGPEVLTALKDHA